MITERRAASELAETAEKRPWSEFREYPFEDLVDSGRVHVDPFGNVHVCQGIAIGHAWEKPFSKIIAEYDPYGNQILEPLISRGPAALVEKFGLPHGEGYADACHLCYATRCMLRKNYPEILGPDETYGKFQ